MTANDEKSWYVPYYYDLMRGKREKFCLDMLVTLATRAGRHVELALS